MKFEYRYINAEYLQTYSYHLSSTSTVKEDISDLLNLNVLIDYNSTIYFQIEILNELRSALLFFFIDFSIVALVKRCILIKIKKQNDCDENF